MKLEVVLNGAMFIELDGVKEVQLFGDEGYYFLGDDEKCLLHVPKTNLAYYKQI